MGVGGVIRTTGGVGVEEESAECLERRLKFVDIWGICCGNVVQWKLSGIYKGDPNEDS